MIQSVATMPETDEMTPVPSGLASSASVAKVIAAARHAQAVWSHTPMKERRRILKNTRHAIAQISTDVAQSIGKPGEGRNGRNIADSMVAEVLPLVDACRFLEREAQAILRPGNPGKKNRPIWLRGVQCEVQRVPLGVVLVIAPSNYPLFLPGVQVLQALAAGNAVLLKPAAGGEHAAQLLARALSGAGLPEHVLQILEVDVQSGIDAIRTGVDKIFLTGHVNTGRSILHEAADALTPSVMELSGCDAVFILPGADIKRVVHALAFGLRLNGAATCMAPRRVFASSAIVEEVIQRLLPLVNGIAATDLHAKAERLLDQLVINAIRGGAVVVRDGRHGSTATPTIVSGVSAEDAIMQTDVFAPLLAFCSVADTNAALRAHAACPYALTAAVFGPAKESAAFAEKVHAGTVLINDLIVSTADPRLPFGGRGASGFGVTRGREGLLEMTAVKTIIKQKSKSLRAYSPTGKEHVPFFAGLIEMIHSRSLRSRINGARKLVASARKLEDSSNK